MQSAESTKKKKMEEAHRGGVDYYDVHSPCHVLKEAITAILKCLGLDCSEKEKNKFIDNRHEQSCQDDQSSSSYGYPTGPPSTETDPPTSDSNFEAFAGRGRTPPRPRVSGGRDPQTNFAPS